ncbi:MAG: ATP-binding cassette domain-containing protein [Clostridiales bacterium]|nr:ATP-binding cassette domain-containing protein [Clostridiales bacterium]
MSHLLEVKSLKKYYHTNRGLLHAVDDVSVTIDKGKTLGVVGESGCGKSTLGKTILRLVAATSGTVVFDGQETTGMSDKEFTAIRPQLQMIFQDPMSSLNPRMNVRQQIAEPLSIYKVFNDKQSLERKIYELMDTVGLARRYANVYPHELDGGRRQRIGIAKALALNPKLIVCDEPVSALDVLIQAQILNLLQDLQKDHGLSYMFITHNLSVVKHISDEICVMYLGQIIERCPTKELFHKTLHPYTKALLSAIPIPSLKNRRERIILRGEITSPINPKDTCRFAPRCIYSKEKCRSCSPQLENVGGGHWVACHFVREINGLKGL